MRYQCVQCNETWTVEEGSDRPRCPKCLRQHGLRKLEDSKPAPAKARGTWPVVVAVVLLAGGAGAYYVVQRGGAAGGGVAVPGLGTVGGVDLGARVQAVGGDAGDLVKLLVADDSVEAFANKAVSGQGSSADQKGDALLAALAARVKAQGFVRPALVDTRAEPKTAPLIAKETLAAISKDGARVEMYPLEISALAVAALRSVDVAASLAEIHRFEGQRAPLDASGRLGYYGVALPAEAGKAQRVLDVYGGRSLAVKAGDFSVLSDEQAMAAALALRGLHRLANLADSAGAVNDADAAVKLAPGSATVRSARAALLIASGGTDEGSRELEAAAQLRADAPRRNNLAVVALAKGEMDVAAKQVALALADAPDFANAHLTLASVHLAQGDRDLARSELEKAENLDPNLAATAMAWAELYAVTGDVDQAVAKAQLAVRLRPSTPETHLVLARVYRRASRFDEMRVEAHKVLDIAAPADKERIRQLLLQMLGPTALEEPTSPEPSADDSALKLSPQSGTGLQLGASEPKLHLGGSSGEGKLKLNLQP